MSILVISASSVTTDSQARLTAAMKRSGDGAVKVTFLPDSLDATAMFLGVGIVELGGLLGVHFQPGVEAGASIKDIT